MLKIFDQVCNILNKTNPFKSAIQVVADGFAKSFLRSDGSAVTATGEMCVQGIALTSNLVPQSLIAVVRSALSDNVVKGNRLANGTRVFPGKLICGVIGVAAVLPALCYNESSCDLAVQVRGVFVVFSVHVQLQAVTSSEYPSFGYMAAQGATTLWETWVNRCSDPTQSCDAEDSSKNHVMFGSVATWLFDQSIRVTPGSSMIRFRHFGEVVRVTRTVVFGEIVLDANRTTVKVQIPAGMSATLECAPCRNVPDSIESGTHIFVRD
jgi:hypothetical protein